MSCQLYVLLTFLVNTFLYLKLAIILFQTTMSERLKDKSQVEIGQFYEFIDEIILADSELSELSKLSIFSNEIDLESCRDEREASNWFKKIYSLNRQAAGRFLRNFSENYPSFRENLNDMLALAILSIFNKCVFSASRCSNTYLKSLGDEVAFNRLELEQLKAIRQDLSFEHPDDHLVFTYLLAANFKDCEHDFVVNDTDITLLLGVFGTNDWHNWTNFAAISQRLKNQNLISTLSERSRYTNSMRTDLRLSDHILQQIKANKSDV